MDERLTETTNELNETKEQLSRVSQILHEKDTELKKIKDLSPVSNMQEQDSVLGELRKKNNEYEVV
jgi:chromosome segregation ATPase